MNLLTWCLIGMVAFIGLCMWVAIGFNKRTKNADDFLVAGRSGKFWLIVGSFIGSAFGGATIAGLFGYGYDSGMTLLISLGLAFPFILLAVLIFGKRLWLLGAKYHLVSIPDFLSLRYGNKIRIPGVIFVFFRMGFVTGLQILATGLVFQTAYGISLKVGMAIGAAILLTYVIIGGAKGSMITEWFQSLLQDLLMILMAIIPLIWLAKGADVGFFQALSVARDALPDASFNIFNLPASKIINYILCVGIYYFADQWIFGRIFYAESAKTAIRSLTVGNLVCLCFAFLPFIAGIALRVCVNMGFITVPDTIAAGQMFFYMVMNLLPVGLAVVLLISYLAAIFSCGSAFILGGAAILTKDVYKTFINKNAEGKQMVRVGRVSTLIVVGVGVIGALWIPNLVVLYNMGNALTACGLLIPVLCAFFWKRSTTMGAVTACWGGGLAGLATALYATIASGGTSVMITPQGIPVMAVGISIALILMIVFSLASKPDPVEQINITAYDKILLSIKEGE